MAKELNTSLNKFALFSINVDIVNCCHIQNLFQLLDSLLLVLCNDDYIKPVNTKLMKRRNTDGDILILNGTFVNSN